MKLNDCAPKLFVLCTATLMILAVSAPIAGQLPTERGLAALDAKLHLDLGAKDRNAVPRLPPSSRAWISVSGRAIRGITVGPIESSLHPGRGYGSDACARTLREVRRLGANWVSFTPFGRVYDTRPTGIDRSFEAPFEENRQAVARAIHQAHAEGLRVLLVPHLWVETGQWRGEINPADAEAWQRWARSYREFLLAWAHIARDAHAEMLAVGVELRSWLTTARAPLFAEILGEVRQVYPGLLTYAGNWDDIDDTVILGDIDLIGINAFYPLAHRRDAKLRELVAGARRVRRKVQALAKAWRKPVLFTEFGYTTRRDPARRPWEWPEHLNQVIVDEDAQALAYEALMGALIDEPTFAGLFVWRLYADPEDVSQEAEWGFSPRGKRAELVARDAFAAHWASDGPRSVGSALHRLAARDVAHF